MATIAQIKEQLNIPTLQLNTANDAEGNKTEWMRHWDNDNRTAVSIHKDLVSELKTNPAIDSLALQEDKRTGAKGEYTALRIVKYTPAEMTL